jgi:curli biogenesis system outer membrane secretion channel CsgG
MNKLSTSLQIGPRTLSALLALTAAHGASVAQTGTSDGSIDKCDRILGTLAVSEPQSEMIARLSRYKLGSPSTMLRMIAQESGCFTVVERGVAMQNIQQERSLAAGGMLQQDSNMGGGQLQAADFVMTPTVQFSDDTGGVGGVVGGLFGRLPGMLGTLGGLAGGVKFKEAETTLLLSDVRSGIQVASAEGKASKMDFSVGGWGWGGLGWASAGGYSKTPEGKLIAASLLDNYNRIVASVRNRPALIQATSEASRNNAAGSTQATSGAGAAVRPVPRAAPAMPAQGGNSMLPSGLIGNFAGSFAGRDEGSFNAVVASNGVISGSGYSSRYRLGFIASGLVTARGEMQMTGAGQAGAATFIGQIDAASGAVSGTWRWVSGTGKAEAGGDFQGQRQ